MALGHRDERATAPDIIATVARKEPELADYLKAAQEVWLLIDCDVSGQSVALDVPVPDFTVATGFRRIYCCGFGRWQWVEVPCVPPSSQAGQPANGADAPLWVTARGSFAVVRRACDRSGRRDATLG